MSTRTYPNDVTEQSRSVANAWTQIDSDLTLGAMNVTTFSNAITEADAIASQINILETQLTNLRNQRDEKLADLWDKLKRVRNGVKAHFGDNSSQYEMVGGTRTSERKAPVRKAKTA